MWSSALLVTVWVCAVAAVDDCARAAGGDFYRRELLLKEFTLTNEMAVNWNINKFYLMKTTEGGTRSDVIAYDLEDKSSSLLGELPSECALTVDASNQLYAGCWNSTGDGGLFLYDNNAKQFVSLTDQAPRSISRVYFVDKLYFISAVDFKLYSYSEGEIQLVPELRNQEMTSFVVDGRGNRVFIDETRLYYQPPGTSDVIEVQKAGHIEDISVDPHGNVYSNGETINRIDVTNNIVDKVLDSPGHCYKVEVDKDGNIFCLTYNKLVRWVRCQP